ncbi:hypothetical protein F5Y19DRAFT_243269 [Xylariaceae sp. FL1651]|nr:hypothetical protein F5Y19DRAFT_243269 [Xylariaceae sp. FL1651]
MADPLTIIGSVAAISQLTSGLVKLTTDLRQHAKDIHKAPEELEFFLLETSNFTGLLNYFTEVADRSSQEAGRKLKKREGLICQIKEQCKYVSDGIENLVRRFGKLAHGNTAPFQTLLERIKWLLDKPDVKTLRLSLQMAMITVNSLTTLFMWEEAIVKNIVNERTKMFEQQLRNWQPMAKKAMKELRKHEQKHEKTQDLRTSNSNHAMLVTSEEIRRRIASVIETHAQPGVGPKRRFRTNREGPQEYMQTPKPVTVPKPRLSSVSPASSASTGSRSSTIARPRDEESSSSEVSFSAHCQYLKTRYTKRIASRFLLRRILTGHRSKLSPTN